MSQHGYPERLSNRSKGFQDESQSQHTMEVLVETLTGTAFEMTVSPSDTIFAIKSKIFRVEGIPVSQQHLLYNLKELDDSASLAEQHIGDGARLRLVLGMSGGPVATRRLPPPEPWHDLERLLENNGEEMDWGSNGCKVTVLVFREGERVNMLRVRENRDGSYSPVELKRCSTSDRASDRKSDRDRGVASGTSRASVDPAEAARDNAVTMTKMMDLRRRMESLSVRRRPPREADTLEIQKTKSEETLSGSRSDERYPEMFKPRCYQPYSIENTPIFDLDKLGKEIYEYDCPLADQYALPPIGTRTNSESSIPEAVETERLSSTLAGPILVKGGRREDEASVVGERLDRAKPERLIRQDPSQLSTKRALAPIPAAEYGPVVGEGSGWRGSGTEWHSGGDWRRAPSPRYLSASSPQLDRLPHRLLPTLSRHRNREHLHLSDEGLDSAPGPPPPPDPFPFPFSFPLTLPPPPFSVVPPLLPFPVSVPAPPPFPYAVPPGGPCAPYKLPPALPLPAPPLPLPAPWASRFPAHVPPTPSPLPLDRYRHIEPPAIEAPPPALDPSIGHDPQTPGPAPGAAGRLRCQLCRRRLSAATLHVCRCGGRYCAPHRYAEVHHCYYDYRAAH